METARRIRYLRSSFRCRRAWLKRTRPGPGGLREIVRPYRVKNEYDASFVFVIVSLLKLDGDGDGNAVGAVRSLRGRGRGTFGEST